MSIAVAIIGGTGFGGGELLRLLSYHDDVTVEAVQSSSMAGKPIHIAHPHLRNLYTQNFVEKLSDEFGHGKRQVIFSSLPHGDSGKLVVALHERYPEATVIDLSGDLRIKNEEVHSKFYTHSPILPELRSKAVYGLPESNRAQIQGAKIIANPGCLAAASVLSLLPLVSELSKNILDVKTIGLHLATGSSGSGKEPKPNTHHPVRHANFYAYKPLSHQHVPEIVECLKSAGPFLHDALDSLSFVPHSLPVSRGILASVFLTASKSVEHGTLRALYKQYYASHPFIRVLDGEAVELENVVGSNFCDISVHSEGQNIIVHAAIDNLIKGMAGQAIQNMNIALDLSEKKGLFFGGLRPI